MGRKKHKRKIAGNPSLLPRLPGAAEAAGEAQQFPRGLGSLSRSAEAQGTRSATTGPHPRALPWQGQPLLGTAQAEPHGGWAHREGIPRAGPLGRLRGSIGQTFVIDGHVTLAWEERAPCRGRGWDMGCGPPARRVASAAVLCARAQQ